MRRGFAGMYGPRQFDLASWLESLGHLGVMFWT
jgi:hypothetical protein